MQNPNATLIIGDVTLVQVEVPERPNTREWHSLFDTGPQVKLVEHLSAVQGGWEAVVHRPEDPNRTVAMFAGLYEDLHPPLLAALNVGSKTEEDLSKRVKQVIKAATMKWTDSPTDDPAGGQMGGARYLKSFELPISALPTVVTVELDDPIIGLRCRACLAPYYLTLEKRSLRSKDGIRQLTVGGCSLCTTCNKSKESATTLRAHGVYRMPARVREHLIETVNPVDGPGVLKLPK